MTWSVKIAIFNRLAVKFFLPVFFAVVAASALAPMYGASDLFMFLVLYTAWFLVKFVFYQLRINTGKMNHKQVGKYVEDYLNKYSDSNVTVTSIDTTEDSIVYIKVMKG